VRSFEQGGDLEQVEADGGGAVVQEHFGSGADLALVCVHGGAAQSPGEAVAVAGADQPCALALGVALASALEGSTVALDRTGSPRRTGWASVLEACVCCCHAALLFPRLGPRDRASAQTVQRSGDGAATGR
jgi:hypothetical protein